MFNNSNNNEIIKHFILFTIILLFLSCTHNTQKSTIAESVIIDSIEIKGIHSISEFQNFNYINDTTLLSYDSENIAVHYYVKPKGSRFYEHQKKITLEQRGNYMPGMFKDEKGIFYALDNDRNIYSYNENFKLKDSIHLTYSFPILQGRFNIGHYNSWPVNKVGDTIISVLIYSDISDYENYFKKCPSMFECILQNGQMKNIKTFFQKPAGLTKYYVPVSSHCYNNDLIALMYPCYDTIYTYNRRTGKEKHLPIHNPDYTAPAQFDFKNLMDFSKITKYQMANFSYSGIFFNNQTKHYIVYYTCPVSNDDKSKNPTFDDQFLKAIVLDEEFNIIKQITFNKKYYGEVGYFVLPGKGLVMPVYEKSNFSNISKFYIYNF